MGQRVWRLIWGLMLVIGLQGNINLPVWASCGHVHDYSTQEFVPESGSPAAPSSTSSPAPVTPTGSPTATASPATSPAPNGEADPKTPPAPVEPEATPTPGLPGLWQRLFR
ncbi:MAG: hypothetical protein OHK0012_22790 [Synechococcales cyanobacterium]